MHVTAFLKEPQQHDLGPTVVLFGTQRFLKQMAVQAVSNCVLASDKQDFGPTRFSGKEAELKTVCDELLTVSMWGDRRLVVVDEADEFVSKNRSGLENYLKNPDRKSVLVLDVKTWTKTTRLAKAVAKNGLVLECGELSGATLLRWLSETSRDKHGKSLARDAVELLVELAGSELGLLDQELAKLAAYVGEQSRIQSDDVQTLVGGWKAETTWTMVNALCDGDLGAALSCLDKLLVAGEAPLKILGGIGFVLRKLARATEFARKGINLNAAMKKAGVFPRSLASSGRYLRRIGRPQAEKLSSRLLKADGDLKGNSRVSERIQLETLLVELSSLP